MLNRLRIFDDVKLEEFFNTTNLDFNVVRDKLLKAKAQGLLQMDDTHYRLTELGRWMLNDILELFL
jgi:oxygen-independent coproporphyrinogen-3 oxidase